MSVLRTAAVYTQELRTLLRDRHVILYSVALPAFFYPAVVLGAFQVLMYVRGAEESRRLRIELADGTPRGRLGAYLEESAPRFEIASGLQRPSGAHDARARLGAEGDGQRDALLVARTARKRPGSPPAVEAELYFDGSRDASVLARNALREALEAYRREQLVALAADLGEDEAFLRVLEVRELSVTSRDELARHVLALVLPALMVFMTALGAFYPALDATVGEKERGTLETTLIAPVPRGVLVAGKYLAVVTLALGSFLLNSAGMLLTLSQLPARMELSALAISGSSLAVLLPGALLLAAFLGAVMMLVAFLARSFREGQAYVATIYFVSLLPVAVMVQPEVRLTPGLALVPLFNIALLFRQALAGDVETAPLWITLGSSAVFAALALWIASRVVSREAVATGGEARLVDALTAAFRRVRGGALP